MAVSATDFSRSMHTPTLNSVQFMLACTNSLIRPRLTLPVCGTQDQQQRHSQ